MKAIYKPVGSLTDFSIVDIDEKYRTNFARKLIGQDSYIQCVRLDNAGTFFLAVDEDGLAKQLDPNFFIELHGFEESRIDPIVGDVVFIKTKPLNYEEDNYDYEVVDITVEDFKIFMNLLNPKKQQDLFERFKKAHYR